MTERKGFVLAALVTACLILFVVAPYVNAGGWEPWKRLEGAWLRTFFAVDENGESVIESNAIYELIPKGPFARAAAVRLTFINPSPAIISLLCGPPTESGPSGYVTDGLGELVMTGPSTYKATLYTYIMANGTGDERAQVAGILVGTATATIVGDDRVEGTSTGEIYGGPGNVIGLPNQDADGDLIPDPGEPLYIPAFSLTFVDNRTPMLP